MSNENNQYQAEEHTQQCRYYTVDNQNTLEHNQ
jgi:hypothetical protein